MKTPQQFYKDLGVRGLSARKDKAHTEKELSYLKRILNKDMKVLDIGCGYGRFTIPLAESGYDIEGIDLSNNLLKKAKQDSKKKGLNIKFKLGDMRKLPYKDKKFDAVICMWSVFIELTKEKDQINSLNEMLRVLKKDGFAFIEIPKPQRKPKNIRTKRKNLDSKKIIGRNIISIIDNVLANPMYLHNKTTILNLMKKIKPKKYEIKVVNFGGRKRMLIKFWKRGVK
jgi:ubiquinone/menaquinone biosynthesis C-methylase UbiE